MRLPLDPEYVVGEWAEPNWVKHVSDNDLRQLAEDLEHGVSFRSPSQKLVEDEIWDRHAVKTSEWPQKMLAFYGEKERVPVVTVCGDSTSLIDPRHQPVRKLDAV
jgi:hypothetical protein